MYSTYFNLRKYEKHQKNHTKCANMPKMSRSPSMFTSRSKFTSLFKLPRGLDFDWCLFPVYYKMEVGITHSLRSNLTCQLSLSSAIPNLK